MFPGPQLAGRRATYLKVRPGRQGCPQGLLGRPEEDLGGRSTQHELTSPNTHQELVSTMGSGIAIDRIIIGEPLPFDIFNADGTLLLAQGQIVESARMHELLMRNGRRSDALGPQSDEAGRAAPDEPAASPLEQLCKDYDASRDNHKLSISMARSDKEKAFPVQLIGVHQHCVIVTAPVRPDGSLVTVLLEERWLCRTFQLTSVFRFTALVAKVAFEPYRHLYLRLLNEVEHRHVRGVPRAKVSLRGTLLTPDAAPCHISDLSTSGARIAVDSTLTTLEKGQPARLVAQVSVMQSSFELSLTAQVVNSFGPIDSRHPQVAFYGLKFETPSEKDHLLLHGLVGEHLVSELAGLWQMLRPEAKLPVG